MGGRHRNLGDIRNLQQVVNFKRPVNIYAYSMTPMVTLHDDLKGVPIELSYHGHSHYNSLIRGQRVVMKAFGKLEKQALASV